MTTVRLAHEGDFGAVCAIVNHYIRETTINFRTEDQSPADWIAAWRAGRDRYPWLVAERDGAVVGLAYAGPWNTRTAYGWTAEVTGYVAPGLRRGGVGRALYGVLLGTLDAQGYRSAVAVIALPNEASAGFHESFGFVPAGVLRDVGYKFGTWCDVGFWQRHAPHRPDPATEVRAVSPVVSLIGMSMPGIEQIDAMYRGEFRLPSGEVMLPPWETGAPEPVVVGLLAAGRLTGRVLDAGCGTGRNTGLIAGSGLDVVGFDGAPTAIERARARHPGLPFVQADAASLEFDGEFDTVLDLGLFHMLPPDKREPYAAGLHRALRPGGSAILVAFTHVAPVEVIAAAFAGGWELAEPEPVVLLGKAPAEAGRGEWLGARPAEDGFSEIPANIVTARRR